jgi:hypothetical protein
MFDILNPDLEARMIAAFSKIPKNKWFYLHKGSMWNFLMYLGDISPEHERLRIENVISEYIAEIEFLQDEDERLINIGLSEILFRTYVVKIIQPYDVGLGFVPVFGRQAYIYIIPFIILLTYICSQNVVALSILCFLVCVYYTRIFIKKSKGKIYGFGY